MGWFGHDTECQRCRITISRRQRAVRRRVLVRGQVTIGRDRCPIHCGDIDRDGGRIAIQGSVIRSERKTVGTVITRGGRISVSPQDRVDHDHGPVTWIDRDTVNERRRIHIRRHERAIRGRILVRAQGAIHCDWSLVHTRRQVAAEVDVAVNFSFQEIFEFIAIARYGRAEDHGDRAEHNIRSSSDKLQIEAMRNPIADELDIKRSGLSRPDGVLHPRVINDLHPRIRRLNCNIHCHIGRGILNRVDNAVRHAAGESRRNLEIQRIARRDRVRSAVRDRRCRMIHCTRQGRQRFQPLTWIQAGLAIGP